MLSALYHIIIRPPMLLIETVFVLCCRVIGSEGAAIVAVSIIVSLLTLPLYLRADNIQEEERKRTLAMEPFVRHIRKTFSGNERTFMLNTLYRQHAYTPLQSLRSTFSLLLQIPFFIAAYRYLSTLRELDGAAFLFLRNLGAPDALLSAGGIRINLMPVLMTLINIIAGIIYTKGFPLKEKAQTFGLAVLFFVLLYRSPSGLVLYWTCNQIFSLCKNLVMRFFPGHGNTKEEDPSREKARDASAALSLAALCFLSLLTGLLIPSALIGDEPQEFVNIHFFYHPLRHLIATLSTACGVFLFWGSVIRHIAGVRTRIRLSRIFAVFGLLFAVNYLFFTGEHGVISASLIFEETPSFEVPAQIVNAVLLLLLAVLCTLLVRRFPKAAASFFLVMNAATLVLGIINVRRILTEVSALRAEETADTGKDGEINPLWTLSREAPNVIVIMLDRAIGGYIPYIMQEKPQLAQQFAGFTHYENTISHGCFTIFGAPELFGGYEYTPEQMNERSDTPLKDKHNEALKVMPALFSDKGFDVTVCDPPYAGYRWVPDLRIYADIPRVRAHVTDGAYTGTLPDDFRLRDTEALQRNLFCYSLFRTAPLALRPGIYDEGNYLTLSVSNAHEELFLNAYTVLQNLPSLTNVSDEDKPQLLLLQNAATHEPILLQLPEYEPRPVIRNAAYEDASRFTLPDGRSLRMDSNWRLAHYHVNMASLLQLGQWFDTLREAGVYDNTRIIIVSDHGRNLGQFPELILDDGWDAEFVNALLMVKDFGDDAAFRTSDAFMTIADTPYLAARDIIPDPLNPFTGQPLDGSARKEAPQMVTTSEHWRPSYHKESVFDLEDAVWYTVEDNIWKRENWKRVK